MAILYFPDCISQWNNLDSRVRNLPSIATFKRVILDFIRPVPTPMFKINILSIFVFFIRLRVGFSHLCDHKFRHSFLDTVDPISSCGTNAVENTEHHLLHCSNFANQHTVLFDDLRNIGTNYGLLDSSTLSRMLLFGNPNFFIYSLYLPSITASSKKYANSNRKRIHSYHQEKIKKKNNNNNRS